MVDVNAYLGHFAFRQLRHNTAAELMRLMDAKGIERAWVSSAAAITYRNAQAGNEEVAAQIRAHGDRFTGFAVLNPAYAGWRDDLAICHEEFGMRGLRLYPHWHGYALNGPLCRELVEAATARKMIISIPLRVEDRRQQSRLVDIPDVETGEIAALVRAVPQARFVLVNGAGFAGSELGRAGSGLPANYWIDTSRVTALVDDELGRLVAALGEDRIVFGSGMPFHYPDPALVKIEVLDAPDPVKAKIRRGNAERLLERG